MSAILSIEAVSHRYGAKQALDNVSFEVEKGSFALLLGPNGAGKSTLYTLLTQLLPLQAGRISIAGHDISVAPRAALAGLGIVFQSQTLDLDLSVEQNLRYFARLRGMGARDAGRRIDGQLERLGLAERRREKVRALNGGHRRRLEIARALLHEPEVLLLDEPTVGLDIPTRQRIVDDVHDLAADGRSTVLWATHLIDEARAGDRIVLLHQGSVRTQGEARALLDEHDCDDLATLFNKLTERRPQAPLKGLTRQDAGGAT
jgi:ABC-2 type transport system ATP-binding protein